MELDIGSHKSIESFYLEKITDLLTIRGGMKCNSGPAQIVDHLYLGNRLDANNIPLLRRLHITHIVNCAAEGKDYSVIRESDSPYDPGETGVLGYMALEACDNISYPILRLHFKQMKHFVDTARDAGGRTLVHCELGVNRSAALCVAYLVDSEHITLMQAIRQIRYDRPNILCNDGFRRQLIEFASDRQLLHKKT